jgi:hypothetical protein
VSRLLAGRLLRSDGSAARRLEACSSARVRGGPRRYGRLCGGLMGPAQAAPDGAACIPPFSAHRC